MEEMREQVAGGTSARLWNKLMKVMGHPIAWRNVSTAVPSTGGLPYVPRRQKRYVVEGKKDTYEQAKAFAEEVYAIPIWSTARRMPRNYSV